MLVVREQVEAVVVVGGSKEWFQFGAGVYVKGTGLQWLIASGNIIWWCLHVGAIGTDDLWEGPQQCSFPRLFFAWKVCVYLCIYTFSCDIWNIMDCLDLMIVWSCCVELVDWQKQHLWLEHMYLVSYQGNLFMYSILCVHACVCDFTERAAKLCL